MKTYLQLWENLAEFLEGEMFSARIRTPILRLITSERESCRLWDNVKKYDKARDATDDSILRRMLFACWIIKATNTILTITIFFEATSFVRKRLHVTLYVHWLSLANFLLHKV